MKRINSYNDPRSTRFTNEIDPDLIIEEEKESIADRKTSLSQYQSY
jgi:hypothetical protein